MTDTPLFLDREAVEVANWVLSNASQFSETITHTDIAHALMVAACYYAHYAKRKEELGLFTPNDKAEIEEKFSQIMTMMEQEKHIGFLLPH